MEDGKVCERRKLNSPRVEVEDFNRDLVTQTAIHAELSLSTKLDDGEDKEWKKELSDKFHVLTDEEKDYLLTVSLIESPIVEVTESIKKSAPTKDQEEFITREELNKILSSTESKLYREQAKALSEMKENNNKFNQALINNQESFLKKQAEQNVIVLKDTIEQLAIKWSSDMTSELRKALPQSSTSQRLREFPIIMEIEEQTNKGGPSIVKSDKVIGKVNLLPKTSTPLKMSLPPLSRHAPATEEKKQRDKVIQSNTEDALKETPNLEKGQLYRAVEDWGEIFGIRLIPVEAKEEEELRERNSKTELPKSALKVRGTFSRRGRGRYTRDGQNRLQYTQKRRTQDEKDRCYSCGKNGYVIRDCPTPGQIHFYEYKCNRTGNHIPRDRGHGRGSAQKRLGDEISNYRPPKMTRGFGNASTNEYGRGGSR